MKQTKFLLGLGVTAGVLAGAVTTPVWATATACGAAEALATEGVITSESELEYAIANGLEDVALGDDFTVTCTPSFITDDFTLDLNGHVLTSEVSWALDIETAGKTLTVKDSVGNGKYSFNDAGIWAQNGANVVIQSGTLEGTGGRGRGVQVMDGKYTMTGGSVLVANESTDWSSVLVFGENASAEVSGGKITSTNGQALYVFGEGNTASVTGGEISSTGDYALMISGLATLTMTDGLVEASDFPLTVFNGSTANISGGAVHAKTGFAVSANFTASPAYMNISGGTLTSDGDFAILFPGDENSVSKLSITGEPVITGAGGVIAMNSGILEIRGGTLTSLGTVQHDGVIGNGSHGFTNAVLGLAAGYADLTARIYDGTFINNDGSELIWTTEVCKGLGTSGTCNLDLVIEGGNFSVEPAEEDIAEGEEADQNDDGTWTIYPKVINYNEEELVAEGRNAMVVFEDDFLADRKATLEVGEADEETTWTVEAGKLVKTFEITMRDRDGGEISVENTRAKVYVELSEAEYNSLKAYDKVEVVYFDADGKESERLEATLEEIMDDEEQVHYVIVFTTTHFSTYGVVGVNEETGTAPDTGRFTNNGDRAERLAVTLRLGAGMLVTGMMMLGSGLILRGKEYQERERNLRD